MRAILGPHKQSPGQKGIKNMSSFTSEELAPLFENSRLVRQHFVIDAAGRLHRGVGSYAEQYEVRVGENFVKASHGVAVTLHWLILNNQFDAIKHLKLTVKDGSLVPWNELKKLDTLAGLSFEGELPSFKCLQGIKSLKHLDLINGWSNSDFTDLPTQLESLILADLKLTDLSQLSHLNRLKSLKLWGMAMESLTGLSKLEGLQELELDAEGISDINELSQLKGLKSLQLPIGCMAHPNHTLPVLEVLSELTQLEQLSIEDLSCEISCTAEILDCLDNHTQLTKLTIPLDRSSDNLSRLSTLPQLKHFALEYERCRQVDIRFDSNTLRHLANLESLSLGSNILDQDLQNLNQLTSLKSLALKQTSGVQRLGSFNLEQLEELSLLWWPDTYKISEQEWTRLAHLKIFKLEGYLPDFSVLKHLIHVEELELVDIEIDDLNVLIELKSLKRLRVSSCHNLSDISALKNIALEQVILLDCKKLISFKPYDAIEHVSVQKTDWHIS